MKGTCVIAGMGPGIGAAVARRFAREGFAVAAIARKEGPLREQVTALEASGVTARAFACDLGNFAHLGRTLDAIHEAMPTPEVVVYNAAAYTGGGDVGAEELVADFRVSVGGALAVARHVLPPMLRRRAGTLLFTGGGLAMHPRAEALSLSIGKAGIRSLALALSAQVRGSGVRVATVTVMGTVQPGTHFDPDRIAERYWELSSGPNEVPSESVFS